MRLPTVFRQPLTRQTQHSKHQSDNTRSHDDANPATYKHRSDFRTPPNVVVDVAVLLVVDVVDVAVVVDVVVPELCPLG